MASIGLYRIDSQVLAILETLIRYYPRYDALANTSEDLIAVEGFDQAEDPIAALADQIADRLALRLGPQLTRLAASTDPAPARELWSARRVAAHYGVGVSFVYQHADELGCVRLGGGTLPAPALRPRRSASALGPGRRRAACRTAPAAAITSHVERPATHQHDEDLLLEFDREP